jgi:tRNA (guanosine-2'-O-)-methyltransferase
MFDSLSFEDKSALWNTVSEYLTEERKATYDRILANRTRHFTIAVQDIFQEHNAGALTRTAECYGVQDLHVMKNHNEFKIAKGMAKGARQWVNITTFDGESAVDKCLNHVRNKGYQIVATTPHEKAYPLSEFDVSQKSAFFFGTEKNGLDPKIIDQADTYLYVPIYGVTESFNVSITAAIIMHELLNKLRSSDANWQLTQEEQLVKRLEWAYHTIRKSDILFTEVMKAINSDLLWRPVPRIAFF